MLGAINGFFVTVLGLPSLAVTIGTLALYRGLAFVVLGDGAVADFPALYTDWVTGKIGSTPIPNVLLIIVVLAVVFGVVLHATPVGRAVFAVGASEQAAQVRRRPPGPAQVLAVRRQRCWWRVWPECSGRCATPAPGPTTAPDSSWRWSPLSCSVASPSSAARAHCPA